MRTLLFTGCGILHLYAEARFAPETHHYPVHVVHIVTCAMHMSTESVIVHHQTE